MKRIFLLSIIILFSIISKSQDTIRLKHTNYISVFSKSNHYPVLVEWWITRAKIDCKTPLARKDNFQPDPLLPNETDLLKDYKGSGTDRGHMMPAAENLCQTPSIQNECFYFSNMAPQYHSLNAGDWKSVESMEREYAKKEDSVHVWCGNLGIVKRIGKVAVPEKCWKVIYVAKSKEYRAYIFNNTTEKPSGLHSHEVTVDDITKLTGFKFK